MHNVETNQFCTKYWNNSDLPYWNKSDVRHWHISDENFWNKSDIQNIETNQTENLEKTLLLLKIQAAGGHLRPGKDLFRPLLSHFSAAAKVYNQLLYQQHPPNSRLLVQNICKICVQMIHSGKIKYIPTRKKGRELNFLWERVATCWCRYIPGISNKSLPLPHYI